MSYPDKTVLSCLDGKTVYLGRNVGNNCIICLPAVFVQMHIFFYINIQYISIQKSRVGFLF